MYVLFLYCKINLTEFYLYTDKSQQTLSHDNFHKEQVWTRLSVYTDPTGTQRQALGDSAEEKLRFNRQEFKAEPAITLNRLVVRVEGWAEEEREEE